jgi:diketogulonate reductase-like aldo/keto reductase
MAVSLPSGEQVPALGQGTWHMGEHRRRRDDEVAALRRGLDLGLTLIDTAEMYGSGGAETVVGKAIAGRRDETFLVSKVLPHHATTRGTVTACEASLRRLGTDVLDLYLLHWPGSVPLSDTLEGFEKLMDEGKIRHWGVSNFDAEQLAGVPSGCATDQILYNLSRRGPEHDPLPLCRSRGMPVMAYSPIEQGRLLGHDVLRAVAERHDATPAQVALAWVLREPFIVAIPKTATPARVDENRAALDLRLGKEDLADLDAAFPPPAEPAPLEIL